MKASLWTICKNAGVTTGAFYFFFQSKGDLLFPYMVSNIACGNNRPKVHKYEILF